VLHEEGKKRESGTGEGEVERDWYPFERENGGRYKQEGEGDGKARTPTHATFSRSFLRSFVRFFVMTVDETMTYFSGFYSRGAPRLCHSHLPSYLPLFLPFRPEHTRVHAAASGAS